MLRAMAPREMKLVPVLLLALVSVAAFAYFLATSDVLQDADVAAGAGGARR